MSAHHGCGLSKGVCGEPRRSGYARHNLAGPLGVRSTPYGCGFYRATASFRKGKSSFSSDVEIPVSQPSPVRRLGGVLGVGEHSRRAPDVPTRKPERQMLIRACYVAAACYRIQGLTSGVEKLIFHPACK